MSTKRLVLQNSALNFVAGISQRIGQALIFILVARQLTAAEAGVFKLSITYTSILLALSLWGLDQLLIRDVSRNKEKAGHYLSNFLLLRVLLATFMWLGLAFFLPLLSYTTETHHLILIMATTIIPSSISDIYHAVWVAFEDMKKFSAVMLFFSMLRLGGGVFILWKQQQLVLIAYWFLAVSIAEMFVNAWITSRRSDVMVKSWKADFSFLRKMLKAATPLIFVYFILTVEYQFDTILLSFFWPNDEVGTYGTAVTILTLSLFLTRSFQLAIFPIISRAYQDSSLYLQRVYTQSMKFLLVTSFFIALSISLFSNQIIYLIFGNGYEESGRMLSILIWAFFIAAFNVPNSRLLIAANHQRMMVVFALLSLVGNLAFSLWLVPLFGGIGTAWARVLSMPLYSIPAFIYVQRHISQINWRDFWKFDFDLN